jgi:hypothetical protein
MFLAFDGNLVGRRLELYLLDNREEDLKCFSQKRLCCDRHIGYDH